MAAFRSLKVKLTLNVRLKAISLRKKRKIGSKEALLTVSFSHRNISVTSLGLSHSIFLYRKAVAVTTILSEMKSFYSYFCFFFYELAISN